MYYIIRITSNRSDVCNVSTLSKKIFDWKKMLNRSIPRFSTIRNNNRSEEMIFQQWSHSMTHSLVLLNPSNDRSNRLRFFDRKRKKKKNFFKSHPLLSFETIMKHRTVPNKQTIFLNNEATQCLVIPRTIVRINRTIRDQPTLPKKYRTVDDPASILPLFLPPPLAGGSMIYRGAGENG